MEILSGIGQAILAIICVVAFLVGMFCMALVLGWAYFIIRYDLAGPDFIEDEDEKRR